MKFVKVFVENSLSDKHRLRTFDRKRERERLTGRSLAYFKAMFKSNIESIEAKYKTGGVEVSMWIKGIRPFPLGSIFNTVTVKDTFSINDGVRREPIRFGKGFEVHVWNNWHNIEPIHILLNNWEFFNKLYGEYEYEVIIDINLNDSKGSNLLILPYMISKQVDPGIYSNKRMTIDTLSSREILKAVNCKYYKNDISILSKLNEGEG